jgi:hypothetical protein
MTEHNEEELETEATTTRAQANAYRNAQQRLKQAGDRAKTADTMRRAAVSEMGQTIRDHRALLTTYSPSERQNWRLDMDQAEDHTRVTRRTLSEAVAQTDHQSDRELAQQYQAADYDDQDPAAKELLQRHPRLAGLRDAYWLLNQAGIDQWLADNPGYAMYNMPLNEPSPSPQENALREAFETAVQAIAGGSPLPR